MAAVVIDAPPRPGEDNKDSIVRAENMELVRIYLDSNLCSDRPTPGVRIIYDDVAKRRLRPQARRTAMEGLALDHTAKFGNCRRASALGQFQRMRPRHQCRGTGRMSRRERQIL